MLRFFYNDGTVILYYLQRGENIMKNPWTTGIKAGLRIGAVTGCRQHTKYGCKTSPAETKNAAANIKKQN